MNRREFLRKVGAGAAVAAVVPMVIRQQKQLGQDGKFGRDGIDGKEGPRAVDPRTYAQYSPADGQVLFTDGNGQLSWKTLDEGRAKAYESHMTPDWLVWTKGVST